jgi:cell wall-associated NlpC family hydrolase
MKKITILLMLSFAAFGHAQVVTSKKEAIKKGIYNQPETTSKSKVNSKTSKNSRKNLKSIINDKNDDDLIFEGTENYVALQMINNAMNFLGVRYRGGGTTIAGMDCSGMVTAVFNIFGLQLPRSSHEMARVGEKIDRSEVKKGDLVFFKTNGRNQINHVGMVVEVEGDEIKFIHSSTQKGVIISSTKEPYYQRTFAQANRVLL